MKIFLLFFSNNYFPKLENNYLYYLFVMPTMKLCLILLALVCFASTRKSSFGFGGAQPKGGLEEFSGLAALAGLGGGKGKGGHQSLQGLEALSQFAGNKDVASLLMSPHGLKGLSTLATLTGNKPTPLGILKMIS